MKFKSLVCHAPKWWGESVMRGIGLQPQVLCLGHMSAFIGQLWRPQKCSVLFGLGGRARGMAGATAADCSMGR